MKLWILHEILDFGVNLSSGGCPMARGTLKPIVYWCFQRVRLRVRCCFSYLKCISVPTTIRVEECIFLWKCRIPQKSWIFLKSMLKNINLSNELLGFSQSGGLWRSRLGFFTPTHVPRGFHVNSTNSSISCSFYDFHVIFPRGRREVESGYAGTLVKHKSGHNFNEGKLAAARIFRF